ncbi:GNAT family N-acetyltransferase, partial [Candidatus Omnitrophota bacterium]
MAPNPEVCGKLMKERGITLMSVGCGIYGSRYFYFEKKEYEERFIELENELKELKKRDARQAGIEYERWPYRSDGTVSKHRGSEKVYGWSEEAKEKDNELIEFRNEHMTTYGNAIFFDILKEKSEGLFICIDEAEIEGVDFCLFRKTTQSKAEHLAELRHKIDVDKDIEIRVARADEIDLLVDFYNEHLFPHVRWPGIDDTEEKMRQELKRLIGNTDEGQSRVLIATLGGSIVGSVIAQREAVEKVGTISRLAIHYELLNIGIGKTLFAEALGWLKSLPDLVKITTFDNSQDYITTKIARKFGFKGRVILELVLVSSGSEPPGDSENETIVKLISSDFQGRVELVRKNGELCIKKSLARLLGSRLLARWYMRRQFEAIKTLQGIGGAPELIGDFQVAQNAFYYRYIEGNTLCDVQSVPDDFFEKLGVLLEAVWARGITHGSLCLRNILIDKQGFPCLIDFESTFCKRNSKLSRWFFKKMLREDIYHLYKLKMRLRPDLMTEQEIYIATHSSYLRTIYRLVYFKPAKIIRGLIGSMMRGERSKRRSRRGTLQLPFTLPTWSEVFGGIASVIAMPRTLFGPGLVVFYRDDIVGGGGGGLSRREPISLERIIAQLIKLKDGGEDIVKICLYGLYNVLPRMAYERKRPKNLASLLQILHNGLREMKRRGANEDPAFSVFRLIMEDTPLENWFPEAPGEDNPIVLTRMAFTQESLDILRKEEASPQANTARELQGTTHAMFSCLSFYALYVWLKKVMRTIQIFSEEMAKEGITKRELDIRFNNILFDVSDKHSSQPLEQLNKLQKHAEKFDVLLSEHA